MSGHLVGLVSLAVAQVLLYQVHPKKALKSAFFLGAFYLLLFSFAHGLRLFCATFSISFYELPLLALSLWLVFGKTLKGVPRFEKMFFEVPNFYFFSGFWISLMWIGMFRDHNIVEGAGWSFFAVVALPILAGLRQRLRLSSPLRSFEGLPLFLISTGFFLLALVFLLKFNN